LFLLWEKRIGKITLLHLVGGLDAPHSGSIVIDDIDITQMKEKSKFDSPHYVVTGNINNFTHFQNYQNQEGENILPSILIGGTCRANIRVQMFFTC
jgi:ABC-type lipoprotein export system ATPase subunit